jgi:Ca-activated chloride channel family protein
MEVAEETVMTMTRRMTWCIATAALLVVAAIDGRETAARASATAAPDAGVTIAGSIVDAALAPVARARISLERAGRAVATTDSDANGTFTFANIAAGDYHVRAGRAGFDPTTRALHVVVGVTRLSLPLVLLRPGEATLPVPEDGESFTVTAVAPLLRRSESFTVATTEVANLPISHAAIRPEPPPPGPTQGAKSPGRAANASPGRPEWRPYPPSTERYAHVDSAGFHRADEDPLSTFGADVDTASFSNVRRFIQSGQRPPVDAVRVEEIVNYFRFAYPTPRTGAPIGVTTEIGDCAWAPSHKLVLIGARAMPSSARVVEGRNVVLLIDVSGSMASPDKLPLVKAALRMFVDTLDANDRLTIVTYAGRSGVALPPTAASERQTILGAIDRLQAGGSTNGGQGLILAYRLARQQFIPGGVNRVMLATDGDFNVGIVGHDDLLHLIEREKASGVFLSVFGVGIGNIKDDVMEMLADKGNGHYAYLDTLQEARRVLVSDAAATLETVAKDVKFQVEVNPARVAAWKLIGYENRALAAEDFNDDRKDGGEVGAGQSVTVLYEVVPVGAAVGGDDAATRPRVDPLKYQTTETSSSSRPARGSSSPEWMTVKVRYELPDADDSQVIQSAIAPGVNARVTFLPLASAAADFGLLLRDERSSPQRWDALRQRLSALTPPSANARDREQLLELVDLARSMD